GERAGHERHDDADGPVGKAALTECRSGGGKGSERGSTQQRAAIDAHVVGGHGLPPMLLFGRPKAARQRASNAARAAGSMRRAKLSSSGIGASGRAGVVVIGNSPALPSAAWPSGDSI